MEQTDEEEREEAGLDYQQYCEYRAVHSFENAVFLIKGIFAFYLTFIFEHIFKGPLHYFFSGIHMIFYAVFLLLLLYALYRMTTKLGFKGSLVLFIISIVYVLNNGGLSVFIR